MNDVAAFKRYQEMNMKSAKKSGSGCKIISLIFLLVLLVGGGFSLAQFSSYQSFLKPAQVEETFVDFEVKPGETVDSIASRLVSDGVLADTTVVTLPAYKIFLKLNPVNSTEIQAGVHKVPVKASPSEVFAYLKSERCDEVTVTLREGLRIEEYADELSSIFNLQSSIFNKSEFISLSKNYQDSGKFSFTAPKNLEGYLFPDTYNFCADVSTANVVDKLLTNFDQKVALGLKNELTDSGKKLSEVANMASILEREARGLEEKKMIADVLEKRINDGIALYVDATSQYEAGYSQTQKTWWRKGSELDQLISKDTPYNTRLYAGLPPTPIANAGLNAFKAVISPTKNSYYYYITGNDGKMYYSKDLNGHNVNVCRYITMQCK
jgi:UPF0755 protein